MKRTALVLVVLALVLVGCGGGDEHEGADEGSTGSGPATTAGADEGDAAEGADDGAGAEDGGGDVASEDDVAARTEAICEPALAAAGEAGGVELRVNPAGDLSGLCQGIDTSTSATAGVSAQVPLGDVCALLDQGELPPTLSEGFSSAEVVDTEAGATGVSGTSADTFTVTACDADGVFYQVLVAGFDDGRAVGIATLEAAVAA